MSLNRFIYYCAVSGGWAVFVAWMAAEWFFFRPHAWGANTPGMVRDTLTAALVGGGLGVGLWVVSGMTNPQWRVLVRRAGLGLFGGLLSGGLGGLVGSVLYWLGFPRAIGWLAMGTGIGVAEGLHEQSWRKTRNGLIGGALGGFLGGWLFEGIAAARFEMSGRATAFVVLGVSVGILIGSAQVVFKEAWLTVLDGYRPGRQLILSRDVTVLGRAEHLPLPFLGHGDAELELEHAQIVRTPEGKYVIEDRGTVLGTLVNSQRIQGPVILRDNDLIRLGTNIVRFSHRRRASREVETASSSSNAAKHLPLSPPPPPPIVFGRPGERADAAAPAHSEASEAGEVSPKIDPPPRPAESSVRTVGLGPMRPPPPPPTT